MVRPQPSCTKCLPVCQSVCQSTTAFQKYQIWKHLVAHATSAWYQYYLPWLKRRSTATPDAGTLRARRITGANSLSSNVEFSCQNNRQSSSLSVASVNGYLFSSGGRYEFFNGTSTVEFTLLFPNHWSVSNDSVLNQMWVVEHDEFIIAPSTLVTSTSTSAKYYISRGFYPH